MIMPPLLHLKFDEANYKIKLDISVSKNSVDHEEQNENVTQVRCQGHGANALKSSCHTNSDQRLFDFDMHINLVNHLGHNVT